MPKLGIVVYTIEKDGCMNGVYTNETNNGNVCNEIAIKKTKPLHSINWYPNDLPGEYDVAFFERTATGIKEFSMDLIIAPPVNGMHEVKWTEKGNPANIKFSGSGYVMNGWQFVVRYQ